MSFRWKTIKPLRALGNHGSVRRMQRFGMAQRGAAEEDSV